MVAEFIQDQMAKVVGIAVVVTSLLSLVLTVTFVQLLDLSWSGRLAALIVTESTSWNMIFWFISSNVLLLMETLFFIFLATVSNFCLFFKSQATICTIF